MLGVSGDTERQKGRQGGDKDGVGKCCFVLFRKPPHPTVCSMAPRQHRLRPRVLSVQPREAKIKLQQVKALVQGPARMETGLRLDSRGLFSWPQGCPKDAGVWPHERSGHGRSHTTSSLSGAQTRPSQDSCHIRRLEGLPASPQALSLSPPGLLLHQLIWSPSSPLSALVSATSGLSATVSQGAPIPGWSRTVSPQGRPWLPQARPWTPGPAR